MKKELLRVVKATLIFSLFICSLEYLKFFLLKGNIISLPLFWRNILNYVLFFTLLTLLFSLPLLLLRVKKVILFFSFFPPLAFFLFNYFFPSYPEEVLLSKVLPKLLVGSALLSLLLIFLFLRFERAFAVLGLLLPFVIFSLLLLQRFLWQKLPPIEEGSPAVLVIVDALRADKVNPHLTPNLMKFASQATFFKKAFSASSCTLPSVFALMTGKLPYFYLKERGVERALLMEKTLAQKFKEKGYLTLAISANRLVCKQNGFSKGFDKFINVGIEWWEFSLYRPAHLLTPIYKGWKFFHRYLKIMPFRVSDSAFFVNREAFPFLEKAAGRKVFIYIHYMDPHAPYYPLKSSNEWVLLLPLVRIVNKNGFPTCIGQFPYPEFKGELLSLYEREVMDFDREFAGVMALLERTGFWKRGSFILMSDHGEEFWEHGGVSHCHSLYNELIRVPLIVKSPLLKPGVREEPVSSSFTVHSLLTGEPVPQAPIWSAVWHRRGFIQTPRYQQIFSFIDYPIKVIGERAFGKGSANAWRFLKFNLEQDPLEKEPLEVEEGEKEIIKKTGRKLSRKARKVVRPATRKLIEQLRALGYVR